MRRSIALMLALGLTLNSTVPAFAQDSGDKETEVRGDCFYFEVPRVDPEGYAASRHIAKRTFAGSRALSESGVQLKEGNYPRYIDRVDIPDYAMELYKTLEEAVDNDGIDDVLIDFSKAEQLNGSYAIPAVQFRFSGVSELNERFSSNYYEATEYIMAVAGAFDRDHPEVFWLNGYWGTTSTSGYENGAYIQNIYLTYTYSANPYFRCDDYTDLDFLKEEIAKRDDCVQTIMNEMPSDAVTDADKMAYFNDRLTKNNEYNTVVSGRQSGSPWEMAWECISALSGSDGADGPVCEGYARAFQVLCMEADIPCVLVSGDTEDMNTGAKNGHMWNYVQLENAWYGVDVTWNDPVG